MFSMNHSIYITLQFPIAVLEAYDQIFGRELIRPEMAQ